ncbi:secretory carrier-associated membrane protein 5A-like [Hylaeus anthracinus]|uniref:secretory carrier-associated membrane protein 5A n=1 Tax=Hylaeus volcanicus TaxID=313075 RepID=UPI0023B85ED8|nr:secretory carrier-associated membrane protein 5A [Hylaeus volcanicus]XP_053982419.1 secretory carrier-associated membrane protein 5A [Hylaeus volcanicus]XP_053982420.1 secretory carrier-associated membrane protein 5A [Hylaeus volcanicus]XP_053982421.1 secretory carrier-associated membrane protein 5A [Hylaeus volcanicus]XP_053982422.1 secretory carrier-associated membrane protein 5A [Hylaeus volcanicus]XP_054009338.1 secretory carrier-associated membrane protein 5A-like [Hylaeus anthracinus]
MSVSSGFDENPFGEPTIDDAFSDPAIRRALASPPVDRSLEDYNPFAEQFTQGTAQVRGAANPPIYGGIGATQNPAMLQPSNQEAPPPTYARTPQQTVNASLGSTMSPTSDQRSEPEWKARTEEDMRNTPYYPKRNNWPPLPDKCCFQPCFYQDIDVEVHSDFQKVVRQLYRLWMFHGCVLVLNVLGGFILVLCYGQFSTFGLGILFLILFTPFSFLCWFRPAYRAFKNDSSFNFMVFFFVFFFQLIVTTIQAIGIPGSGTCGIITAISSFNGTTKGTFVGLILLFISLCFVLAASADLLLLTKIHRIYRSSDASISKAQQEFATTFLRNEHVQTAASNVAANAVRSQMANAANQPRY